LHLRNWRRLAHRETFPGRPEQSAREEHGRAFGSRATAQRQPASRASFARLAHSFALGSSCTKDPGGMSPAGT